MHIHSQPVSSKLLARQGFTLVELLIYTGLTVIILGLLSGILVTVTRIQGVQDSSVQVTKELGFLMNTIKQSIYSADSFTSISANSIVFVTDGVIKTIAYLGTPNFKVTIDDPTNGTTDLSSSKMQIDDLVFTELRDGVTASRAIQIEITATANTDNAQKTFQRSIRSTVAPFVLEQ